MNGGTSTRVSIQVEVFKFVLLVKTCCIVNIENIKLKKNHHYTVAVTFDGWTFRKKEILMYIYIVLNSPNRRVVLIHIFDTINHDVLLDMYLYGICVNSHQRMKSYLSNRKQFGKCTIIFQSHYNGDRASTPDWSEVKRSDPTT